MVRIIGFIISKIIKKFVLNLYATEDILYISCN
jgi:hypothetical protein